MTTAGFVHGDDADRCRYVGQSIVRQEDPRLLAGRGCYVADIDIPGLCHAAFVRSPHAHARIVGIATDAARLSPGVVGIFTAADLPSVTFEDYVTASGLRKTPQPVLATDRARFAGEPVAIVVARSRALAEDAAELVDVTYQALQSHTNVADAGEATEEILFDHLGSNVIYDCEREFGDVEAAFATADHVVRALYRSNRYVAAPMETAGILASPDLSSGRLTVWASTQAAHLLRTRLAEATGLADAMIRVIVPDVGGAFGQKIPIRVEEAATALAAMELGCPVRWVEDRLENLMAAPHAKEQLIDIELALRADGTFLALRADVIGDAGAYSHNSASALIEPHHAAALLPGVYRIDTCGYRVRAVLTNKSPVAPYRGVGMTAGHTAREIVIERAARLLGRDPADLRLQNMIGSDEFPFQACTGQVYDSGSFRQSLERALEVLGYRSLREEQQAARQQGRYLGVGLSPLVEPTGWGTEGARQAGSSSFVSHDAARVTMDPNGSVIVSVGTSSQGQGHATTLCQLAAEVLGVSLADTTLRADDTDLVPISTPGTRASRVAVVIGGAVQLAAMDLRDKLLEIAAELLRTDRHELEIRDGRIAAPAHPGHSVSVQDVARAAHFDAEIREAVPDPHLSVTRFYDPKATYSNGTFAAVVEVDSETGGIEIRRLVAIEDCGTIINPLVVDGQTHGAMAQGVGGSLLESMVYDGDGQLRTSTFMDYLLPSATELPTIEVFHLSSPSPHTVGGIKGMGESASIATPAAVANAVVDALAPFGVEMLSSMPLHPHTIVRLIDDADGTP